MAGCPVTNRCLSEGRPHATPLQFFTTAMNSTKPTFLRRRGRVSGGRAKIGPLGTPFCAFPPKVEGVSLPHSFSPVPHTGLLPLLKSSIDAIAFNEDDFYRLIQAHLPMQFSPCLLKGSNSPMGMLERSETGIRTISMVKAKTMPESSVLFLK